MNKITIGCDIGGVVKNQMTELPIDYAITSLKELSENEDYKIIFISKCKDSYKIKSEEWLKSNGLENIQAFYCLENKEKIQIARRENVRIMIDDKIQVLSTFDDYTLKIWLCDDHKKIEGTKKFQPDLFAKLRLALNWQQAIEIINNNL
jgi:hypothetical protein